MKTLIKPLLIALSLGFTTSAASFAETKPILRPAAAASYKVGMYPAVDGKFVVLLDKQQGGHVDIQLKSDDGTVLYTEHLGKKQMKSRRKLNLNDLEDGLYTIEVTNGVETTRQTVTISTRVATSGRTISLN
ncbi:hypothetical protein HNV11_19000 [Spirosoma taeanense]|uniref:T9SS type A sorting domain-containing protein n=1 Tax=Spirosoma taeanense TaxID=2735870 RepID=A0A6M5YBC8_9BACT|nr:hypothetical protein [Spirosoma taeanense]QJW91315.1 hypothetical protein HNV11_19000 [Spirosoma taeanense]